MDKLIISIHNKFLPEKKYIIDTIVSDFLGLDYELRISENPKINYTIKIVRKGVFFMEDNFFSKYDEETGYLFEDALPGKPSIWNTGRSPEGNLPIIYGNNRFTMTDTKGKVDLLTGIDIFASTFFMLTRWEEIVIDKKDEFGRFDEDHTYSVKYGFFRRPLVNEYVDYFWTLLKYMGFEGDRKPREYTIFPTHDIDFLRRYTSKKKMLRSIAGNLKKERRKYFFKDLSDIFKTLKDPTKDPFLNFDFLMNVSESIGVKSQFFIIPSEDGEEESTYSIHDQEILKLIDKINSRGHHVCYHPSRATFHNSHLFKKELGRLRKKSKEVYSVRQHHLQFSNPYSWQIAADYGIRNSSNMSYSNKIGFRSGCCYEYNIFNVVTREKLDLIEWPLVFMESALIKYAKDKDGFLREALEVASKVRKYNGNFVFLWHNSNFNLPEWRPVSYMYNWFVGEASKKK